MQILCFIFHLLIGINLANALLKCDYSTGNFTANSTYAKNRNLFLSSLPSNVTANGGFYNTTISQGTDTFYGQAFCRYDISFSSEECSKCLDGAIEDITKKCPTKKEVTQWWSDPCYIRYGNNSFFGRLEADPTEEVYNTGDLPSEINQEEFDQIWETMMSNLATTASMGTFKAKFATNETDVTSLQKIYALMQCTPDLTQQDCNYCLRSAATNYIGCCHGKRGGVITKPSCNFRWDLYPFYNSTPEVPITPSPSPPPFPSISPPLINNTTTKGSGSLDAKVVVIVVVPTVIFLALVALFCACFHLRKPKKRIEESRLISEDLDENSSSEHLQFTIGNIRIATNNFSDNNKLGQGGFGSVYKGILQDGQPVAVKRLLSNSEHGKVQFENEVKLLARLHHRNLVRLLGFCFEGNEKLLVYEFVPNSSLDCFIFGEGKRFLLDWKTRYKIIMGIARGLLYLHEDSRLRIIHRDLKLGNILLDELKNPKIADFGIAKLFAVDQSEDATTKVIGTYGYMAPEYAINGLVSVKSDVFSYGAIILEIITGRKIGNSQIGEQKTNLLTYAWDNWDKGTALNIVDPILMEASSRSEILRCIHIAFLCLQEDPMERPTVASIILMQDSNTVVLTKPSKPAYLMHSYKEQRLSSSSSPELNVSPENPQHVSDNEDSITELEPR